QRLRQTKGAYRALPRGRVHGRLRAEDEDRSGCAGLARRAGIGSHHGSRGYGLDRRWQGVRLRSRARRAHSHGRDRRRGALEKSGGKKVKTAIYSPLRLVVGLLAALGPALAFAQAPDKGDTAWMLTSTALVLLMSVPALALFYGGLVRSKNMLSVLM